MITKALVRDGGLFIPNIGIDPQYSKQKEVQIEFEIIKPQGDGDIFKRAAGILKRKKIDPLKFQSDQRREWDG